LRVGPPRRAARFGSLFKRLPFSRVIYPDQVPAREPPNVEWVRVRTRASEVVITAFDVLQQYIEGKMQYIEG